MSYACRQYETKTLNLWSCVYACVQRWSCVQAASSAAGAGGTSTPASGAAATASTVALANMSPPLLPGLAKERIQNLHNAVFAMAKRIVPSSLSRSRVLSSSSSLQQSSNGNSSGATGGEKCPDGSKNDGASLAAEGRGAPPASSGTPSAPQSAADSAAESTSTVRPKVLSAEDLEVSAKLAKAAGALLKSNAPGTDRAALQQVIDTHHEDVANAAKAAREKIDGAGATQAGAKTDQNGTEGSKKRPAEGPPEAVSSMAVAVPAAGAAVIGGSGEVEVLDLSQMSDTSRPDGEVSPDAADNAVKTSSTKKLKVRTFTLPREYRFFKIFVLSCLFAQPSRVCQASSDGK